MGVEGELAQGQDDLVARTRSAQHRAQAGLQLIQIERLDQIVVGPGVQSFDPLGQAVARGQDQGRRRSARTGQQGAAIAIRQAEVDDHGVVRRAPQGGLGGLDGRHAIDHEPLLDEVVRGQAPQGPMVFDQENSHVVRA